MNTQLTSLSSQLSPCIIPLEARVDAWGKIEIPYTGLSTTYRQRLFSYGVGGESHQRSF